MRNVAALVLATILPAACAGRLPVPPPTDKVQTEEQAIAIAKAHCEWHGQEGAWGARWQAGKWVVQHGASWPLEITIESADGKPGECRYEEY